MLRRGFMKVVGAAAVAGGVYVAAPYVNDPGQAVEDAQGIADAGNATGGGSDPMTQSFGFGSPGFEQIAFVEPVGDANQYVAEITFGGHSMDGFGIRHRSQDANHDLARCGAPPSTGTVTVDLLDELRSSDAVYPNRKFDLVAYDGEFSDCDSRVSFGAMTNQNGTAGFTIPASIAPAASFRDMQ